VAGVKQLYELSAEQCEQVNADVKVVRTRKSGIEFIQDVVLPAIVAFQPDLIIINPVMAFTDCDVLKQDEAPSFFRRVIGEILDPGPPHTREVGGPCPDGQ
jgi:hydroxymethylpyrimidine/phosphomethylpyrimidine kinase